MGCPLSSLSNFGRCCSRDGGEVQGSFKDRTGEEVHGDGQFRLVLVGNEPKLKYFSGMVSPSGSREFYLWKVWKKKVLGGAMWWTIALFLFTLPFWVIPAAKGGSFCSDYWKNQTNAHLTIAFLGDRVCCFIVYLK